MGDAGRNRPLPRENHRERVKRRVVERVSLLKRVAVS